MYKIFEEMKKLGVPIPKEQLLEEIIKKLLNKSIKHEWDMEELKIMGKLSPYYVELVPDSVVSYEFFCDVINELSDRYKIPIVKTVLDNGKIRFDFN